MLLTNYSELHNQTCTITTLPHQFTTLFTTR